MQLLSCWNLPAEKETTYSATSGRSFKLQKGVPDLDFKICLLKMRLYFRLDEGRRTRANRLLPIEGLLGKLSNSRSLLAF